MTLDKMRQLAYVDDELTKSWKIFKDHSAGKAKSEYDAFVAGYMMSKGESLERES